MGSPRENLAAYLLQGALDRGWGERIAIRESERVWTYSELADNAGRLATALRTLRVGSNQRVAVFMRDSLEAAAAILGTMWAGSVAVPISELATPIDVRNYLNDSGAIAAIVHADLEPTLDEIRAECPSLREVLTTGQRGPGERDYHASVRGAAPAPVARTVEPEDIAMILYSAGGAASDDGPRGVPHSHRAPIDAFEALVRGGAGLREGDRVFSVVRLSTAYGLGTGLFFPLAAGAETMLLPEQPRSDALFAVISELEPTVLFATPSLYSQLARDAEAAGLEKPLASLRVCVSGAEGMPPRLIPKIRDVLGTNVIVGYGLTEAFQFVLMGEADEQRPGACGQPVPGFKARIVDKAGNPQGANEIGTLQLSGPTLLGSYWGNRGAEQFDGEWFTTRDRFMMDEAGNFFHCGRADDLFKVGGKWVSPTEVERALLANEAVWECAVIGADDEDGLIKPFAFVVPNIGQSPGPDLERELRQYVKSELAPYKYPRWIQFVESLPKGPNGKILRYKLRVPATKPRRAETAAE